MLCVKNVSLRLPESRLLTNVNFTVDKGDIVTLMGPSGCGKSTLFSWMIGALAEQFSCTGELWLNEQRIDILPTAQRQIGILFQDALLFDQFSVGQNLLLALPATLKGNARRNAVNDALERSGLEGAFHQDPATLSGGQRARVALLRALLAQPKALLPDEPFSRLDVALRDNFRQWVFSEVRAPAIPRRSGNARSPWMFLLIVLFWIWRSGQKITTNCDNAKFFSMRQFRMAHSKLQCRDFR